MKISKAYRIVRELRLAFGYTQNDIASWLKTDRSNYTKKEKAEGGVTLTADEFLLILNELQRRGPKNKSKNDPKKITDISEASASLIKQIIVSLSIPIESEKSNAEDVVKLSLQLDRYEKLASHYDVIVKNQENRIRDLENRLLSGRRKDDPDDIDVKKLRRVIVDQLLDAGKGTMNNN